MKEVTGEIIVARDVFSDYLLSSLQETALGQEERKKRLELVKECPKPILAAANLLCRTFCLEANTAILKRYRIDDKKPSGAYAPHPDPDEFSGSNIGLFSLDGEAVLSVQTKGEISEVGCRENTLVILDPDLLHWVTPPQNQDGVRHLLFFGFDHTKPATIE